MENVDTNLSTRAASNPHDRPDGVLLRRYTRLARAMYKQLNAQFFRNRLSRCGMKVVRSMPQNMEWKGGYVRKKNLILFHWDVVADESDLRQVLLHEMCHAANPQGPATLRLPFFTLPYSGIKGVSGIFAAIARRITGERTF